MDDVIAAVLAGGVGERLGHLTRDIPKPLVPYAGSCRMVDFSLDNCARSDVRRTVLMSKHMAVPLIRYLQSTWGDRLALDFGHFRELATLAEGEAVPDIASPDERGTADALITNRPYIDLPWAEHVLVLHCDHIYNFDYRAMVRHHRERRAALTIGYQRIERRYVSLFGMVDFDSDGRLTAFVEKPAEPTSDCVFTAVGIFDKAILYRYLDTLARGAWRHDISFDLIPAMLAGGETIVGFPFTDYWEDIGTIERYHGAHLRLAASDAHLRAPVTLPGGDTLVRPAGSEAVLMPAALANDAFTTHDSVIFPGARVGAGATIVRSVVLPGAIVPEGTVLQDAVLSAAGVSVVGATHGG
jgi:valienol-1-phosphate guanylyltransferase